MKTFLVILLVTSYVVVNAQRYDYAEITTVQAGQKDRASVVVNMTNIDSSKYYTNLKLKHIVTGIELMESRGFEVVSIVQSNYMGAGISTAYMRRKRK